MSLLSSQHNSLLKDISQCIVSVSDHHPESEKLKKERALQLSNLVKELHCIAVI